MNKEITDIFPEGLYRSVEIKSIKKSNYNGKVYDLTVDKVHTYCTGDRIVGHNSDMASRAKDINLFFGIFDNAFERTNIALVFANKMYTNMGNVYDPWTEAGGQGAIYNPSLSLLLKDTTETRDITDAELKEEKDRRKTALGSSLKIVKATVDKSRFGTEMRNISFLIDFAVGPYRLSGLFQLCEAFGLLVKSGTSYTLPGVIEDKFFKKDFIAILEGDEARLLPKLQAKLEEAEQKIKEKKLDLKASDLDDVDDTSTIDLIAAMDEEHI